MDDLTGQTFGDYQVLRRLGRGAMAVVYLARQASLDRQVALKVLNAELARDQSYVSRFQHEARAAAALVHANIVQVYEVGVTNDRHFIAQEYVAGDNLGELLQQHGALEPGLVLNLLRQVAAALCRASESGIVHRDIKPENLMLAHSGEVKVADFGLARIGQEGVKLTQVGVTMGTPLYMSPEQVAGQAVDARSDLYSLGVTAYHLLVGSPPFEGETPLSVAVQHLNNAPPDLLEQAPTVPTGMAEVIQRLMAKRPQQRPAGPAELLAELNGLLNQARQEGWAAELESVAVVDTIAQPVRRPASEATQQLDVLMAAEAELKASAKQGRAWLPFALAACLLVGVALALVRRPQPLLSATPAGPAEKETVLEQVFHAKLLDTEAAWKIIPKRFPNADELYLHQAKEGLARYYLDRGDHAAARPLCAQLAALDSQPNFQLFGWVGLVICDATLGESRRAERLLNNGALVEALPQLRQSDPKLYDALQVARDRLRSAGDSE